MDEQHNERDAMNEFIGKQVVVTTEHRGVFFGTLHSLDDREAVLHKARVCVYWSPETRGFIGLAATGPGKGSRVSAACESLAVNAVTSVSLCSAEAVKAWESGQWS